MKKKLIEFNFNTKDFPKKKGRNIEFPAIMVRAKCKENINISENELAVLETIVF